MDVSTQKLYTISDTTEKYLKDMNTDVTIYHIVQSGKEDSVLEKMLTRYEEESKHIKVEKKTRCYIRTLLHSIPAMMWQITV